MAFKAEPKKVYDLFNTKCYLIPRNQRRYVWDKRNWEELYDDIAIVMDQSLTPHFIGSFVLNDSGRNKGLEYFTIIDGQQRIITLSIMIASILYWLKMEKFTDDYLGTIKYVFATDDKANKVVMLQSDYHLSLESIIKSIEDTPEEMFCSMGINAFLEYSRYSPNSDQQIVDAFIYFLNRIKDEMNKRENHAEYLRALRDTILDVSNIIIIAYSEEDSYTIFEILNARGVILEDHELLKNYIMRYIQPEETRDKAKAVWSTIEDELGANIAKFVMHYAKHKCNTFTEDLSVYKNIQRSNRGKSTEDLLRDLKTKANYYSRIVSPASKCKPDSVEYRVFSFFKRKRQEILRPAILSLMHQNAIGKLTDRKYEDALVFLYNFFVCYNIIGEERSNKLTNAVSKYAALIENQYSDNVIEEFVDELRSKLPSKEQFTNSFMNLGWTHHHGYFEGDKNKDRVQTVLEVLERYLSNGECPSNYTIEHILPDAADRVNGQIGNLLPLEEGINKTVDTIPIQEKIKCYKTSIFNTVRSFASRYEGKEFDPEARTKYLAGLFYERILRLNET